MQKYTTRFASKSRKQLRADIVGDDVSTIASGTTMTSSHNDFKPTLPPIMDMDGRKTRGEGIGMQRSDSQETFTPPPSYRSGPPSVIMTPTHSSLSGQSEKMKPRASQRPAQTRPPGGRRTSFFKKVLSARPAHGLGAFGGGGGGDGGGGGGRGDVEKNNP